MSKPVAIVTGSGGLVGSAMTEKLIAEGYKVYGVDNNQRARFFGPDATIEPTVEMLQGKYLSDEYNHFSVDLITFIDEWRHFVRQEPEVVVHCAAQPSHDYAAKDPYEDWRINATATHQLLEMTRQRADHAAFVFLSTNKVYGDRINDEHFVEQLTRWEVESHSRYWNGVAETFPVDQTKHSLFGASKLAADILVQEYGRYFGMNTGVFRGGCLSGARHSGVPLHGFLSYLVRTIMRGEVYTIIGYGGKQVRDNIDSADLSNALMAFIEDPDPGAVYNIGGGRENSISVIEAAALVGNLTGKEVKLAVNSDARIGDHQWWITDMTKFKQRYPAWSMKEPVEGVIANIIRWEAEHEEKAK